MRLTCYALHEDPPKIIPAPAERAWMELYSGRHPYRCLPLAIGNCYGWQLLLAARVKASWNGGPEKSDLAVENVRPHTAVSNFSRGVITFDVPILFRTDPGYQLMVTGPTNEWKDGAAPMTALIETEWLSYTFTMNYQFTRPGTVVWEQGEPFCQIFVVPSMLQESVEPEMKRIKDNPEAAAELAVLTELRTDFRARQDRMEAEAIKQAWQRFYFKGIHPDGRAEPSHQVKMRLREVEDRR